MRNSDPGVSIVSVQRHNSDLNSVFTMQITGCNFQHGPNFGVPLDPSFWLWCFFFSWKSVFTTGHCMKLLEICSVFRPQVLSNFNNVQKSCIHTAAIEDLGWLSHHNPKALLSWSHWARVRNSIAPSQRVSPFSREVIHTLHISPRLLRKDWADSQRQLFEK